ncbi:kinase-like protein [Cenococcum geophilum]
MSPTKTVNLSNVILILRNFKGTPNILILSKNSRYEFTPPIDALPLIKNNKTGISRRYIRFNISPVISRLRVKTLSTNPVYIINSNGRKVVLTRGLFMEISGLVTINLQTANNTVYIQKWGLKRKGSRVLVIGEELRAEYKKIIKLREYVYNGIVAIYNKDFAYRDLKPKNILIKANDNGLTPKIANFRKLKLKALENITTFTGSLLYIAPELYITNLRYSKAGSYSLLSPRQHNDWVYNIIPIYVASTLETFRSMLKGLLYKEPKQRYDSKKRPAPAFKDDGRRNIRSQHPT